MTDPSLTEQAPLPIPADSNIDHASAIQYWNSIPATVNGMLGGFPQISRIDMRGSANFLAKVHRLIHTSDNNSIEEPGQTTTTIGKAKKFRIGLDGGAGIGRVTEGVLSKVCDIVDVVEPIEKFAQVIRDGPLKRKNNNNSSTAEKEEGDEKEEEDNTRVVENVYITGLESWQPSKQYDLIWNQWCVGHLTDAQLIDYLKRAAQSLSPHGFVVLKENLSTDPDGNDLYDELDNSVTRTDESFRRIFRDAGLNLIKSEEQLGFPKHLGLLPVRSYALRPLRAT